MEGPAFGNFRNLLKNFIFGAKISRGSEIAGARGLIWNFRKSSAQKFPKMEIFEREIFRNFKKISENLKFSDFGENFNFLQGGLLDFLGPRFYVGNRRLRHFWPFGIDF